MYADDGFHDDHEENAGQEDVFLFFGPMMCLRLTHVAKDAEAKRLGVRVVDAHWRNRRCRR